MLTTPRYPVATAMLVALICVAASAHRANAEALYAFDKNGDFFSIIDRSTGVDIVATGTPGITGWRGAVLEPVSGTLYATDAEYLYTIDLTSGTPTQIGLFGSIVIRDLAFDDGDQLYGVTGNQGDNQHSLHLIDPSTAQATLVVPLSGVRGHALALDPSEPGVLYHLAENIFEKINLSTLALNPIGLSGDPIVDSPLGMTFDPVSDVFRLFDNGGRYYTLERDGTVSQVGQSAASYFGLAYDERPSPIILFRDGFESGDTLAWEL